MSNRFSTNDNQAERGPPGSEEHSREFRHNAKSWALYLQDAEENAKELAEVWKTGLESLLIFAGLFAGVITSFLGESRKKLRQEDQETLLMDIRSTLLKEPLPGTRFSPRPLQLWVNGLWFTSLLMTLFSAIVAVLARSWLVNHLPISSRKEAVDACRRYRLDERAERWMLSNVITGIPVLVQVAFFLFSVGLALQTYDDNEVLGIVVLALVACGTLLYLAVTALPLLAAPDSCPFHTPVSDLLRLVWSYLSRTIFRSSRFDTGLTVEQAPPETLAMILHKGLVQSQKTELIDEAAFELNRQPPSATIVAYFLSTDLPISIFLGRIRDCTTMRFEDPSQRDTVLEAHLRVVLRLVASWETGAQADKALPVGQRLRNTITKGEIFSRWDSLPDSVRPLLFAVRISLYLASEGLDFEPGSPLGKQWQNVSLNIKPEDRLAFVKSACRGLVQGPQNINRVSVFTLVHLIGQSYLDIAPGRQTEWNSESLQHRSRGLCKNLLQRLLESIERTWQEGFPTFVSPTQHHDRLATISTHDDHQWPMPRVVVKTTASPAKNLVSIFLSGRAILWSQGPYLLNALAQRGSLATQSTSETKLLSEFIESMYRPFQEFDAAKQCIETVRALCGKPGKGDVILNFSERIYRAMANCLVSDIAELCRSIEIVEETVSNIVGQPRHEERDPELLGLEDALWLIAPHIVALHLSAVPHPGLRRWVWLKTLLSRSTGDQWIRVREQLRPILSVALADAINPFKEVKSTRSLQLHERLGPISELISFAAQQGKDGHSGVGLLDFDILEEALIRNDASHIMTLILQSAAQGYQGSVAAVTVFLALAERCLLNDPSSQLGYIAEQPSRNQQAKMYQALRKHLQSDDAPRVHRVFVGALLNRLKRTGGLGGAAPNEKGDKASYGLRLTNQELLSLFVKSRWDDQHAVDFLAKLADQGTFQDALVACLPENMQVVFRQVDNDLAVSLVTLVHSLVCHGWAKGMNLLIDLAIYNRSSSVNASALESVLSLLNREDMENLVSTVISLKSQRIARELRSLGAVSQEMAIANWKRLWILSSPNDTMKLLCLTALSRINDANDFDLDLETPVNGSLDIEKWKVDPSSKVRQAALEIHAQAASEENVVEVVTTLLRHAYADPDEDLRFACLDYLITMASNVKFLPVVIQRLEHTSQARKDSRQNPSWRRICAALLKVASCQGSFPLGVTELVQLAFKHGDSGVRETATQCLYDLADANTSLLTQLLANVVLDSSDHNVPARTVFASAISRLSELANWKDGIQVLVDLALNDTHEAVRFRSYKEINRLLDVGGTCARWTMISLTQSLSWTLSSSTSSRFPITDFIGSPPVGSQLLRLLDTDITGVVISAFVEHILTQPIPPIGLKDALSSIATTGRKEHHKALIKSIMTHLGASTPQGATHAMILLHQIWVRSKTKARVELMRPFIPSLRALLQHVSKHVRIATMEVVSKVLCEDPGAMGEVVSPLISIALEDHDHGSREGAMDVLCLGCENAKISDESPVLGSSSLLTLPSTIQSLLELLSSKPTNAATARLLSALARSNAEALRQIGLWTVERIVRSRETGTHVEQGILCLLSELTSRKRLDPHVPLHYLLILIASSLALKGTPATEEYRPLLLASLSLHYKGCIPTEGSSCFERLVSAFEHAAFGRHGTVAEAETWLRMEDYLKHGFPNREAPPTDP